MFVHLFALCYWLRDMTQKNKKVPLSINIFEKDWKKIWSISKVRSKKGYLPFCTTMEKIKRN